LSIGTIYRLSDGFREPLRSELQTPRDYTLYVINKDWRAHRQGLIPMGGEYRLQVIREQLLSLEPAGKTQEILQVEVLRYFNTMIGYRQQRLSGATSSIPAVLWYVVAIGSLINIAFHVDVGHEVHAQHYSQRAGLLLRDHVFLDLYDGSALARGGECFSRSISVDVRRDDEMGCWGIGYDSTPIADNFRQEPATSRKEGDGRDRCNHAAADLHRRRGLLFRSVAEPRAGFITECQRPSAVW
jgi:hypothetical protein